MLLNKYETVVSMFLFLLPPYQLRRKMDFLMGQVRRKKGNLSKEPILLSVKLSKIIEVASYMNMKIQNYCFAQNLFLGPPGFEHHGEDFIFKLIL